MKTRFILSCFLLVVYICSYSQTEFSEPAVNLDSCISSFFDNYPRDYRTNMPVALDRYVMNEENHSLDIYAKEGFASQVFTPAKVDDAYARLIAVLPKPYNTYKIRLMGFGREVSELVPNAYRNGMKDSTRMWSASKSFQTDSSRGEQAYEWTRNISLPVGIGEGLQGCHLTIWPSHGRYYDNAKKKWRWQRPNLWCTTEDLFTRSFVVPFLFPMLERAGAVVWCPRERDWHSEEIIVGDSVHILPSVKRTGTITNLQWLPDIPYEDDYALYVRYPEVADAVPDAIYTVRHGGTNTRIRVNQQMGYGTWVYLGTFHFTQGQTEHNSVSISNLSDFDGVVVADAIRIGGGMGSVRRGGVVSTMPRYLEGSRYYAEYIGLPKETYSMNDAKNDYVDDYTSRSTMLNYVAGGSNYVPDTVGLRVPMEMSLAVHSDAGWFKEDRPFGTLAIYTINGDNATDRLRTGVSRMANSDLACMMQTDICRDLTAALGSEWPKREIYNRNYSESRKPEVPSMILETLSHQNFLDMLYGHDPVFKFLLSRSIYKAITKFVATQHGRDYTIQPLPVCRFSAEVLPSHPQDGKRGKVKLSWAARTDSLEPSAQPTCYVVYTARDGEDFDNGRVVAGGATSTVVDVDKDVVYRFRLTACNNGGESWPSETLAALCASGEQHRVLVVNGFTRLSSPAVVSTSDKLGFDIADDIGVSYVNTAEYCGAQTGFHRSRIGIASKGGLGFSGSELEGQVIGGNTFDYPYTHAQAISGNGKNCSISSCSMDALTDGQIALTTSQGSTESEQSTAVKLYELIDVIFGLQKDCGRSSIVKYKTFTPVFRDILQRYMANGGNVLISGSFVGSDMRAPAEQAFTKSHFGYTLDKSVSEHIARFGEASVNIVGDWNPHRYAVQHSDALLPSEGAEQYMHYANGDCAGVHGRNSIVLGFPFEAVSSADDRQMLMGRILQDLLYKF